MRTLRPTRICRRRLLRHAEVDVDRIERLQRHQRVAAGRVLTEVDVTDAEHAGERRADRLAVDGGADFADARVRLPLFGRRAIELRLRDDPLVQQPFHPLEVDARELALRLGRRQLRLLLARIEQRQHLAFANRLAGLERDPIDGARQIGGDGHALHRRHRADRAQRRRPAPPRRATIVVTASGGGWKRRRLADRGLNLPELHEARAPRRSPASPPASQSFVSP